MLDILVFGGQLVDGTIAPSRKADIAVNDGEIAEEGRLHDATTARLLEVDGRMVAPGFIDIHSHNELYVIRGDYRKLFKSNLR